MYGVDMRKPGAQDYYDGVFAEYARWGVDFVKVDDLSRPYDSHAPEIEAIARAIARCGRPMVLSMSPGETPVVRGEPVHGHASPVFHDGRGIFEGIPVPFDAARYHSLRVRREDLPPEIEVTAWTEDDVVMGLARRDRPWFGVQFHPESILTPEGPRIVGNFLALA